MKTFKIGGVHPHDNKLAAGRRFEPVPLPKEAIIQLNQHIGAPAVPVVEPGEEVKVGQLIAKANGFVSANIHSSVSGKVTKIDEIIDAWGAHQPAIFIEVEGDVWMPDIDISGKFKPTCNLSADEIKRKIADAGIVGLGGACFPTHIKYMLKPEQKCEYLIVNAAECEPYISTDNRVILERCEQCMIGIEIALIASGAPKAIIGIEDNKPRAIAKLMEATKRYPNIEVQPLNIKYPQGAEKQLIKAITGRSVPNGALPISVGCIVNNITTMYTIYLAVQKNKPIVQTYTTVSGRSLRPDQCKNYRLRIGTPILSVLQSVGIPEDTGKIISGGPMMGKAIANLGAYTAKGMSSLLFMNDEESVRGEVHPCLRCGKCVSVCPMGLEPYMLQTFTELKRWDDTEKYGIMNCIECGSCSFICPSNRPILDMIRVGKAKTGGIIRSRAAK